MPWWKRAASISWNAVGGKGGSTALHTTTTTNTTTGNTVTTLPNTDQLIGWLMSCLSDMPSS